MERNIYIFHGRFQPFHIGHLSVLNYLLTNTENDIIIGIINPNPLQILPGDDKRFVRFSPERNPLSFWERYHCINLINRANNWEDRIIGIVPLPRPSINLKQANCYIPNKPRTFVICNRGNDEIERWKKEQYEKNDEKVFLVPVYELPPFCQLVSGEFIRCLIALKNSKWKDLIPFPARTYMEEEKLDLKIAGNITPKSAKMKIKNLLKEEPLSELAVELFPELCEELLLVDDTGNEYISSALIYKNLVALQEKIEKERKTKETEKAMNNIEKAKEFAKQNKTHKVTQCLKEIGKFAKDYSIELEARVIERLIKNY